MLKIEVINMLLELEKELSKLPSLKENIKEMGASL